MGAKLASELEQLKADFELFEVNLTKPIRFDENTEFDISHLNSILRNGLENGDFFISGKLNVAAVIEALRLKLKSKLYEDLKTVGGHGILKSLKEHEAEVTRLNEKIKKLPEVSSSDIELLVENKIIRKKKSDKFKLVPLQINFPFISSR